MLQIQEPENIILIKVQCFGDAGYIGYIDDPKFMKLTVQSDSVKGCLKELAISIEALESYRKTLK